MNTLRRSLLILSLLLASASTLAAASDKVAIKDIKALRDTRDPSLVVLLVTVNYRLSSHPEGVVRLGVDLDGPDSFRMIAAERIAKGKGTVELTAQFQPSDRRTFVAYANLSEYPTPKRYRPLTGDRKALTLPAFVPAGGR